MFITENTDIPYKKVTFRRLKGGEVFVDDGPLLMKLSKAVKINGVDMFDSIYVASGDLCLVGDETRVYTVKAKLEYTKEIGENDDEG